MNLFGLLNQGITPLKSAISYSLFLYKQLDQNLNYTVFLKNIGYTPATHLRLTKSYPDAKLLHSSTHYQSENMTLENSTSSSLAASLPRLTAGASISVDTSITRSKNAL